MGCSDEQERSERVGDLPDDHAVQRGTIRSRRRLRRHQHLSLTRALGAVLQAGCPRSGKRLVAHVSPKRGGAEPLRPRSADAERVSFSSRCDDSRIASETLALVAGD